MWRRSGLVASRRREAWLGIRDPRWWGDPAGHRGGQPVAGGLVRQMSQGGQLGGGGEEPPAKPATAQNRSRAGEAAADEVIGPGVEPEGGRDLPELGSASA